MTFLSSSIAVVVMFLLPIMCTKLRTEDDSKGTSKCR